MNWLIYTSGWVIGWGIFNGFFKDGEGNLATIIKLVIWTNLWIWICWKFIK
jgi:hypothetical protein